jgi:hypothetical protein
MLMGTDNGMVGCYSGSEHMNSIEPLIKKLVCSI